MSDRFLLVMVASALGLGSVSCGDSSSPDTNNTTSGSSSGGGGSGGAAGSTSGGGMSGTTSGGAGGSTSGGMSGMSMGGSAGSGGSGGSSGAGGGGGSGGASPHGTKMSFFVSSTPAGNGTGKLGGLAGADMHCKTLAMAANAARTQWVAYLSVAGTNAKDRIGAGPWYNADEEVFAANQAALHALPMITMGDTASRDAYIAAKPADDLFMDENGDAVPSDVHDILTGTNPDGTVSTGNTCGDWTLDTGGMRMVGHSDTPGSTQFSPSWNAAHASPGCDAGAIESSGGEGRIYCFATD